LKLEVEGVEEIPTIAARVLSITIEFSWGTDVDARLVDVNKLQQVEALRKKLVE